LAGLGMVVLAPAANAGTITPQVHCELPFGQGIFDGPMDMTVEITPETAAPGSIVRAKVTLGNSPVIPRTAVKGVKVTTNLNLVMSGGASGPLPPLKGPELTRDVVVGEPMEIPPFEADIRVPSSADGLVTFNVVDIVTDTLALGIPTKATCAVTSGGENIASVTAEGGTNPSEPATLTADPMLRGAPTNVSGTKWTPGATPLAALCETGVTEGNVCSTAEVAASALSIDASGNLSGTATAAAEATVGDRFLRVSDGDKLVYAPVTVGDYTPSGPLEFTTDISSGPVGSVVTLTGKNGPANFWVYVEERDKDKGELGGWLGFAQTDAYGNWTTQYPITSDQTAFLRAINGVDNELTADMPFEITLGVVQNITAAILPGNLAISQAGNGIDFGSTTLNGQEQELSANLNQVTVVDARSGNLGWSLTGTMTDLTAPEGGTIPAGNVSWTPACAASENSPSAVVTGSAGPLGGTAATLCSAAPDGAATTGGTFTADAGLKLTTPAFVTPGAYAGTLTLSLS